MGHDSSRGTVPLTGIQLGRVKLRVADLARSVAFYTERIGLEVMETGEDFARLGARVADAEGSKGQNGGTATDPVTTARLQELVRLQEVKGASPRGPSSPGLYHLAILVPHRRALAETFLRIYRSGWRFQGFSDHAVSEALYLADPEGNGLEIYADRPADEWKWDGHHVQMTTRPLDMESLLRELEQPARTDDSAGNGRARGVLPPGSRMGHVHLRVTDLARAERFYSHLLGLDVVARGYPGALFMSADGYHHHVAVNVWGRRAGYPTHEDPPSPASGLDDFAIILPDEQARDAIVSRMREAGFHLAPVAGPDEGWRVTDPDGNGLCLLV